MGIFKVWDVSPFSENTISMGTVVAGTQIKTWESHVPTFHPEALRLQQSLKAKAQHIGLLQDAYDQDGKDGWMVGV